MLVNGVLRQPVADKHPRKDRGDRLREVELNRCASDGSLGDCGRCNSRRSRRARQSSMFLVPALDALSVCGRDFGGQGVPDVEPVDEEGQEYRSDDYGEHQAEQDSPVGGHVCGCNESD